MRSIEPGISRFRVRVFDAPRNDDVGVARRSPAIAARDFSVLGSDFDQVPHQEGCIFGGNNENNDTDNPPRRAFIDRSGNCADSSDLQSTGRHMHEKGRVAGGLLRCVANGVMQKHRPIRRSERQGLARDQGKIAKPAVPHPLLLP